MSDRFIEEECGFDIVDTLNDLYYESSTDDILVVLNNMDDEVKNSLKIISRNIFYTNESENKLDLNEDELKTLQRLLYDVVEYGHPVPKVRNYLNILDKIEKLLEKNKVNQ